MTPGDFTESVGKPVPPPGLSGPVQALWWAAKGDWEKAHTLVMSDETAEAAWVHAYLHRLEGDLPNARYWYRVAAKPEAQGAIEEEWNNIVGALL